MKKKKSQTNMPLFLKKIQAFLKKYWKYALASGAFIVGLLLLRKDRSGLLKQLEEIRTAHEKEIKQINAIREAERLKNEEDLFKLQKRLAEVQKQYDEAKIELDKKKKKEIEDLITQFGDDPVELAERLSAATGFRVILPE